VIIGRGIFAIRSGSVGSGMGCKKRSYPVEGRDGEVISSQPVVEFYPPYADYRIYRH